jgi:hypothetical protein
MGFRRLASSQRQRLSTRATNDENGSIRHPHSAIRNENVRNPHSAIRNESVRNPQLVRPAAVSKKTVSKRPSKTLIPCGFFRSAPRVKITY